MSSDWSPCVWLLLHKERVPVCDEREGKEPKAKLLGHERHANFEEPP